MALCGATASATPVCTGGADVTTLGTCEFGGLIFSGWSVLGAGLSSVKVFFGTGSTVGPSTVNVNFQVTHTPSPVSAGADILLSYAVSGLLIGVDLFLGTTVGPVTIIENVCAVPFVHGACPVGNLLAAYAVNSANPINAAFFAPHHTIYIKKDIQLGPGAAISDFTNSHHVPEPLTLSLTGLGLLAAGWLGRRKVRN
ncbi:MAG: PEP-CTERM sorting domain-containing protein [Bryobacteraceae bacterium]|nr:PEP-CTERM sorting domain-containing protein [Bryobacteraceae bacterium]